MFSRPPTSELGIWGDYGAGLDFQPKVPEKCWSDARLDVLVSLSDASRTVKATNSELRQGLDFICNQLVAAASAARSTSTELREMSSSLGSNIVDDLMVAIDSMEVVSSTRAVDEVLGKLQSATNAVNRSNTGLQSLLGLKELGRLSDAAAIICDVSREARYRLKIHRAEFKDIQCAKGSPGSDIQSSRVDRSQARSMMYRLAACLCLATVQFAFATWSKVVECTKRTLSEVSHHQISRAWNLSNYINKRLCMSNWLLVVLLQWRWFVQRSTRTHLWRNNAYSLVSHMVHGQDDQFVQVVFLLWSRAVQALQKNAAILQYCKKNAAFDGISRIALRRTLKASDFTMLQLCMTRWRAQVLEGAVELACSQLGLLKSNKVDALSSLAMRWQRRWQNLSLLPSVVNAWRIAVKQGRHEHNKQVNKTKLSVFMVRSSDVQLLQIYLCAWQRLLHQRLQHDYSHASLKVDRLSFMVLHHRQSQLVFFVFMLWRTMLVAIKGASELHSQLFVTPEAGTFSTVRQVPVPNQQVRHQGDTRADLLVRGRAALTKRERIAKKRAARFCKQAQCNLLYLCMTVWHLEKFLHAAELRQSLAKEECGKDLWLLKSVSRKPGDSTAEEMAKQFAELSDWQSCLIFVMVWRIHVFTEYKERSLERILEQCQNDLDMLLASEPLTRWKLVADHISERLYDLHYADLEQHCLRCWARCVRPMAREEGRLVAEAIPITGVTKDVRGAIAHITSRWLEIAQRDLGRACFSTWRFFAHLEKTLREEGRNWEEHVTSIHRDNEMARLLREEREQEILRISFAHLQKGASNVVLMWAHAAVQHYLIEVLREWRRYCQVQHASGNHELGLDSQKWEAVLALENQLQLCKAENERQAQELASTANSHAMEVGRLQAMLKASASSSAAEAMPGPGRAEEEMRAALDQAQAKLSALQADFDKSKGEATAKESQLEQTISSLALKETQSQQTISNLEACAGTQKSRCAEAVELATRNCQRRFDEELVLHCTSMWHLQASTTAMLLKAEKDVQQQCDEQLERLQQQHMCGMEDLRRKCEEIAASSDKQEVTDAGSSLLTEDDEAWIAAMQSLVNDLQQENEALHRAVKAQKYGAEVG